MTKEEVIYELDHSNRAVNIELDKQYNSYLLGKAAAYDEAIELVKEIDEPERKRGRWIKYGFKWKCSECDGKINIDGTPEENGLYYCPNCGADMRGK